MAYLRALALCVLSLTISPAAADCTAPIAAFAHEPTGVFVVRRTTPDNTEAQCGSVVDACVIHKKGVDYILIRNDLAADAYRCTLLTQFAKINARQL